MGLFILFILLLVFYIVDCVLTEKLNKSKQEELRLLRIQTNTLNAINEVVLTQRNMYYLEIQKFNDNVEKFNKNVDKFTDGDDGK
jgi:hypothetical protein